MDGSWGGKPSVARITADDKACAHRQPSSGLNSTSKIKNKSRREKNSLVLSSWVCSGLHVDFCTLQQVRALASLRRLSANAE